MFKSCVCALALVFFAMSAQPVLSQEPTKKEIKAEKVLHPRIAKAINELKDAIEYMQKAPHDFGGHKAEAIAASEEAIKQLKLALAYRAEKDTK
ncbi:MAG TPA: hypothetical protein VLX68_02375 [Chitinivibrionales bacterium]|nr:hypothetical protein [Chitinivibrionales bacterium]